MGMKRMVLGASLVAIGVAAPLCAQGTTQSGGPQASAASTEPGGAADFGDIVVTAQRRAENIQDVPLSVTAVTGNTLRALNIVDTGRIELLTPGLTWGNEGGARAWPSMRGVETVAGEGNGEPALAFFSDGIYRSRTFQAQQPLVDIARVEVLRGPQGTLFGRNSTGGAINVIANDPTSERFLVGLDATAGAYENFKVDAFVNVPITDRLSGRFATTFHSRKGYVKNLGPGNRLNDQDLAYFRGALKYDGGDFTAKVRVSHTDIDRNGAGGFAGKVLGQTYRTTTPVGRSIDGQVFFINPRVLDGVTDVVTSDGVARDIGTPVPLDPYEVRTDFRAIERTRNTDGALELSYDFGPAAIKSITAYTDFYSFPIQDNDFTDRTAQVNQTTALITFAETFQQELQLASSGNTAFTWVIGGFYLHDKIREKFQVANLNALTPSPFGLTRFVIDRRTRNVIDSYAGYAQGSYKLSDQFSVTLGGRYTRDEKDYRLREAAAGGNPSLDVKRTFKKFTWRGGVEFRSTDDNMIYASYSTGFRSGGFNRLNDAPSTPQDERVFESETIAAYEIGSKNSFLDNRMILNLAGYYQKLRNQQVQTVQTVIIAGVATGQSGFFNAGTTGIWGVEAELQARPVDGWLVQANLTYLDAQYDRYTSPAFQSPPDPAFVSLAGNRVPRAAKWKVALTTSYDVNLNGPIVTPAATVQASSAYFQTQFNTAIDRQEGYAKLDLRLGFRPSAESSWRIEGFVENVTDKAVVSYGTFGGSNALFVNYLPPRTWGVRLSFRN